MIVVVLLATLIIYIGLGYIFGFAVASHNDVLSGVRPESNNKFITFICRPTTEIKGVEKLIFSVGMIIWTLCFFALIALPVVLASKNSPEYSDYIIYAIIPLMFAGKLFGALSWKNVPKKNLTNLSS